MKLKRLVAIFLMMVLVSSQALASACLTSCVVSKSQSQSIMGASDMTAMSTQDCHHSESDQDNTENFHNQCNMAGCHIAQAAPFLPSLTNQLPEIGRAHV